MNLFQTTVSALSYSIIRERCRAVDAASEHPQNRVAAFVLEQHGRMAMFLQWPFVILTVAFDAWGVLKGGRPFHQQSHEHRWAQVEAWRASPIGLCRDLVRFYESLAVFGCFAIRGEGAGMPARSPDRSAVAEAVGAE